MAKLIFLSGPYAGKGFTLPPGKTITIGRNRDIELPLPDLKLSRRHCMITSTDENKFFINDLESTNGTTVNGIRLNGGTQLNSFDRVVLGDTEIEFQCPDTEKKLRAITDADAPEAVSLGAAVDMASEEQASQPLDPLEAALQELSLPLPPEPPALNTSAENVPASTPKVIFCDGCSGSISMLDWDLGVAKEIDKQIYCKECLAKRGQPGSFSKKETVRVLPPAPPAHKPQNPAQKNMDAMLAALDQEPEVIDITLKRRGQAVPEPSAASASSGTPSPLRPDTLQPQKPVLQPVPAPVPVSRVPSPDELFGEEFEEIG